MNVHIFMRLRRKTDVTAPVKPVTRPIFAALRQRIADWHRERHIAELLTEATELYLQGDRTASRAVAGCMYDQVRARSPQQVARMEARWNK